MNEPIDIFHQKVKLPLFCISYDVAVGKDMQDVLAHMKLIYPGLNVKLSEGMLSYSCVLSHPDYGNSLIMMIATDGYDNGDDIRGVIAHEATNLAWQITDLMDVEVRLGNHSTQCFIVGELVSQVHNVIATFEEHNSGLAGL